MKYLKRYTIIGIIFVLLTGTLAHFAYQWSGDNHIVGFFTPVNESVWEHIKLLFFPMFLYALVLIGRFRKEYPCIVSALCFGMLAGAVLIPVLFYAYTAVAGRNYLILDITVFLLSIVIAFWLACRLTQSCRLEPYTVLLCVMVLVLIICFMRFSYHPPDDILFEDPTVK